MTPDFRHQIDIAKYKVAKIEECLERLSEYIDVVLAETDEEEKDRKKIDKQA